MKRAVAIVVILTMVLHFASRSGFISYLYSQRHNIALHLGLIDEKPIASCDGNYFSESAPLIISNDQDDHSPAPSHLSSAKEIFLFLESVNPYEPDLKGLPMLIAFPIQPGPYTGPSLAIFQPPRTC